MSPSIVNVSLGDRAYPIHIGAGVMRDDAWTGQLKGRSAVIVSSPNVAAHYLAQIQSQVTVAAMKVLTVSIADGEAYKSGASLNLIYDTLLENECDRKTVLIALGGGVIGDLTGFAAATYQRGIDFIQIPTTLLAMVDSSVGGKTAINHPRGKNMIGAFHQPVAVLADIDTLATLPDREYRSGLAEVMKYGFIYDAPFLVWLEQNIAKLVARDVDAVIHAVRRSCEIKAEIVVADEREQGIRAWLNLGHTFGHAIETGLGYGKWLHGEAVATGMVMAGQLSAKLGHITQNDVARIQALVEQAGLPTQPPALGAQRYLDLMRIDKKADGGKIRYVILKKLGEAALDAVPDDIVRPLVTI
jgi:3-dehydroquinate synthase